MKKFFLMASVAFALFLAACSSNVDKAVDAYKAWHEAQDEYYSTNDKSKEAELKKKMEEQRKVLDECKEKLSEEEIDEYYERIDKL